jgi:CubicO group peptidase (beta-lactamase class C family)
MKKNILLPVFSLIFVFLCCNPDRLKPSNAGQLMAKEIDKTFKDTDIGYAFMMMQEGKVIAQTSGGLKSKSFEDQGALPFTIDTKMGTGSSTKTITALAFMKLCTQKNIKPSDKIIDFLPPQWQKGKNLDLVTFADLMTHSSGFRLNGEIICPGIFQWPKYIDTFEYLKTLVSQDINPSLHGSLCYFNPNMTLFRILIPSILGYQFTGNDDTDGLNTGNLFFDYLQKEIFDPFNITNTTDPPVSNNTFTKTYEYPSQNRKGFVNISLKNLLGAGGLNLTMTEYCKLYHSVFGQKDGKIVPTIASNTMLDNEYGLFKRSLFSEQSSHYFNHGGLQLVNYCPDACIVQGCHAIWLQLPDGSTCSLFVNAVQENKETFVVTTKLSPEDFIITLYKNALKSLK